MQDAKITKSPSSSYKISDGEDGEDGEDREDGEDGEDGEDRAQGKQNWRVACPNRTSWNSFFFSAL